MYTFINLQKIIDTLPKWEKNKLDIDGAKYVQVCLDDIWNGLSDDEKKEFLNNNSKEIMDTLVFNLNPDAWNMVYERFKGNYSRFPEDLLEEIDTSDIICYLDSCGYSVYDYSDDIIGC